MTRARFLMVVFACAILVPTACGSDGSQGDPTDTRQPDADLEADAPPADLGPNDVGNPDVHDASLELDVPAGDAPPSDAVVEDAPEPPPEVTDAADAADGDTMAPAIAWGPCPSYIAYTPGFECAFVPAPLDYDEHEGASIDVFVYRLRAADSANKRQIWFLQGGPGGSGADFAQVFWLFSMAHPEWEMYSLDHRGVATRRA